MTVNYKDFNFGPVNSGEVAQTRIKASAFFRLGKKISLPPQGAVVTGVTGITSRLTKEGTKKPVNGKSTSVKIGSNKFASIVVETKEAADFNENLTNYIYEVQPAAHGEAADRLIAGLDSLPVGVTDFVQLQGSGINEVYMREGADAAVDLDDAIAAVESGQATGIALSSAMLSYIRRQRIGATGARTFEVVGDNDNGTIDGLPYATFKSSTPIAFVGDFDRFYYGADENAFNRIAEDGIVDDDDDITHNLTTENKIAIINEVWQGAGVITKKDFVRVLPASLQPPVEG